jgi:hypothetical protein
MNVKCRISKGGILSIINKTNNPSKFCGSLFDIRVEDHVFSVIRCSNLVKFHTSKMMVNAET